MTAEQFLPHLEAFIKEQEAISANWNGEDDSYTYDGDVYHEDDAHIAQERAEAAAALLKVINEYDL
jgi:hypothetical protein